MTPHDHDPEEADLKALFDGTADELGGPQLTKLKARAADIPLQHRPIWWRVWAPVFAVAMGAILVLGVRSMNRPETNVVATMAKTARPAPAPSMVASAEEPDDELDDDSDSLALFDEDESEDVYLDDGSEDLLAFGVPSNDDDIDAWLEATDELLGEGG